MAAAHEQTLPRSPVRFAIINVSWLGVLILLLAWRWRDVGILGDLPDPMGGVIPLIVPWGGALGGVAISLMGTAKHSVDWDESWNIWHAIRPFLGAVAGTLAFVMVVVVLRVAGGLQETDQAVTLTPVSIGLFLVIAFVVGFRDRLFLELVAKVAKVLFSNGDAGQAEFAFTLDADEIDFGRVSCGESVTRSVHVLVTSGTPSKLRANWHRIEQAQGPVQFTAALEDPPATYGVLGLSVRFAPTAPGGHAANLVILLDGISKQVSMTGTGVVRGPLTDTPNNGRAGSAYSEAIAPQ
jgi:hypothetical protein